MGQENSRLLRALQILEEISKEAKEIDLVILSSWQYRCIKCDTIIERTDDSYYCPNCEKILNDHEVIDREIDEIRKILRSYFKGNPILCRISLRTLEGVNIDEKSTLLDKILDEIDKADKCVVILFPDRENRLCTSEMYASFQRNKSQSKFIYCQPYELNVDLVLRDFIKKMPIRRVLYSDIPNLCSKLTNALLDMLSQQ